MAYTVEDLLSIFRLEVEDTVETYFWSDQEFFWYLTEAQKEFAIETSYFKDSSTISITEPLVTVGSPWIDIDARIIDIRRVKIGSRSQPMRIVNFNELDREYTTGLYGEELSGNWSKSKGTPRLLITDEEVDKARLVPIPSQAETIKLTVVRLPLKDIEDENSILELSDSAHQRSLLMFCKGMAYEKQDADSGNQQLADRYKAQFYQYCNIVNSRQAKKQRRVGTVKYGGL